MQKRKKCIPNFVFLAKSARKLKKKIEGKLTHFCLGPKPFGHAETLVLHFHTFDVCPKQLYAPIWPVIDIASIFQCRCFLYFKWLNQEPPFWRYWKSPENTSCPWVEVISLFLEIIFFASFHLAHRSYISSNIGYSIKLQTIDSDSLLQSR